MREWLKTIIIPFESKGTTEGFPKGKFHSAEEAILCDGLLETDGGCPVCMEELEYTEDMAIKLAERDKYEFRDIMCTNRSGYNSDERLPWLRP